MKYVAAAYLLGFVLTFGEVTVRYEHDTSLLEFQRSASVIPGFMFAALWPAYWPMRLSYLAFEGLQ